MFLPTMEPQGSKGDHPAPICPALPNFPFQLQDTMHLVSVTHKHC
jgi:hypothetical protein